LGFRVQGSGLNRERALVLTGPARSSLASALAPERLGAGEHASEEGACGGARPPHLLEG